jgi:nucleoside-diphosphate-sugar epimerase
MRLLITGAMGHIGSKLIHDLNFIEPFSKITLIDNFLTQRYVSLFNLAPDKFKFIEQDARSNTMEYTIKNCDLVLHLAAITNAIETIGDGEKVLDNNLNSTKNVVDLCFKHNKSLLFISSTSVYGMAKDLVDEEKEDLLPQTPYAEVKLLEEEYIRLFFKRGLRGSILRFGTIYGNSIGMRFHTAVNKFCYEAALGRPLTIWDAAYEQKRPYLYLGDAVKSIQFALSNEKMNGNLYNVLTNNSKVKDIIDIIKVYCPNVELNFTKDVAINQNSYEVSSKKIKSLGFCTEGDLQNGIAEIFHNFSGFVKKIHN